MAIRPDIERHLRRVFPTGKVWEPDSGLLYDEAWRKHVDAALVKALDPAFRLNAGFEFEPDRCFEWAITQAVHPRLWEDWLWQDHAIRTAWLDANGGVYPVLWLRVSRVWPTSWRNFNFWHTRGGSGYLDVEAGGPARTQAWRDLADAVDSALRAAGIEDLADAHSTVVPFVLAATGDDSGDGSLYDDWRDDVAVYRPVMLTECLFRDV